MSIWRAPREPVPLDPVGPDPLGQPPLGPPPVDLDLPAADRPATWLMEGFNACVHHFVPPGRDRANVVCLGDTTGRDALEVAGLLVHEAVHCFQRTCLWAGEDRPSEEFEAYAIQNIAMRLMHSYARQKGWRE